MYALYEFLEVARCWRWRYEDTHPLAFFHEHAIGGHSMEVDVQIQASAEALRKRHGTCGSLFHAFHAGEALGRACDFFGEDAAEGGKYVWFRGRKAAQFEGQ